MMGLPSNLRGNCYTSASCSYSEGRTTAKGLRGFSKFLQVHARIVPRLGHGSSYQILSSSSVILPPPPPTLYSLDIESVLNTPSVPH
jgi:hypothetical protein